MTRTRHQHPFVKLAEGETDAIEALILGKALPAKKHRQLVQAVVALLAVGAALGVKNFLERHAALSGKTRGRRK